MTHRQPWKCRLPGCEDPELPRNKIGVPPFDMDTLSGGRPRTFRGAAAAVFQLRSFTFLTNYHVPSDYH